MLIERNKIALAYIAGVLAHHKWMGREKQQGRLFLAFPTNDVEMLSTLIRFCGGIVTYTPTKTKSWMWRAQGRQAERIEQLIHQI